MRKTIKILLCGCILLSCQMRSAVADAGQQWYLDTTMIALDESSRYVGSVAATNPGDQPIYVRVTHNQVAMKEGRRVRLADEAGVIKVSPSEFVLRPKETFRLRILGDAKKLVGKSASYYIKIEDISQIKAAPVGGEKAMASAYLLAYEALVNISTGASPALRSSDFSLNSGKEKLSLTNNSSQHIYLDKGAACPDAITLPVDCSPIANFPKQSMLPGETVQFAQTDKPFIVILAQPKLSARTRANRVYLSVPR